jgi:hypothetical protein
LSKLIKEERLIISIGMIAEETELKDVLHRIKKEIKCQQLRIGVVGVWTDAKVFIL